MVQTSLEAWWCVCPTSCCLLVCAGDGLAGAPLPTSARISALSIVGELLRKVGVRTGGAFFPMSGPVGGAFGATRDAVPTFKLLSVCSLRTWSPNWRRVGSTSTSRRRAGATALLPARGRRRATATPPTTIPATACTARGEPPSSTAPLARPGLSRTQTSAGCVPQGEDKVGLWGGATGAAVTLEASRILLPVWVCQTWNGAGWWKDTLPFTRWFVC